MIWSSGPRSFFFFFFLLVVVVVEGLVPALLVEQANRVAPELMREIVMRTPTGLALKRANSVSGGSAKLRSAKLVVATTTTTTTTTTHKDDDDDKIVLECEVEKRPLFGSPKIETERVFVANPVTKNGLASLACDYGLSAEAARLLSLEPIPGQPADNLWLNNVPNPASRAFFKTMTARAVVDAAREPGRYSLFVKPPELDDELDTYRVGTLLELARNVVFSLIKEGYKVKVMVQGPMGSAGSSFSGVPLSLNGVRRLLEGMDWGEDNLDLIGKYLRFGDLEAVDDDDDVFVILAPQSMVGCSVVEALQATCRNVGDQRPLFLINPKLADIPSPQGVMSVRGRADRLDFAATFQEIYRFRVVVPTGRTFFPILGALVRAGPRQPYVLYKRTETSSVDFEDSAARAKAARAGDLVESYVPVAAFSTLPDDAQVTRAIRAPLPADATAAAAAAAADK
ncbi:hypothetical protein CTAYLR_002581 [Chrysophaeum taylorii]|uniref:DUF1995 domain-containing protein n=1 Tax=Chrysophaeum taylorii TaxID=2483200 RepID=A0AAD7UDX7_9STRA|nr:hypothetical protein CTAYLR_002581 [Chrysophaeum taylorii]